MSEDPLRANTGPLLPDVAGLDDQPAGYWKRLAWGHDIDYEDHQEHRRQSLRLRATAQT